MSAFFRYLMYFWLFSAAGLPAWAQLPNSQFNRGNDAPEAWTLAGGQGRWVDREILEVTGTGDDSSFWHINHPLKPGGLYRFQTRARRVGGNGYTIAGPTFANRDYFPGDNWQWIGHTFRVPESVADHTLRVGQWHADGAIQFDAVRLYEVMPVHKAAGQLVLGEGESIRDGHYRFLATYDHPGSNYHRPLHSTNATFNSNRWWIAEKSHVTYRFALPGHKFLAGKLSFNVNHHVSGGCRAEVSRDGADWRTLATQSAIGTASGKLPEELLPAETLLVRLTPPPEGGRLQINRLELTARLDGSPTDALGETIYANLQSTSPGIELQRMTLQESTSAGRKTLVIEAKNTGTKSVRAVLGATVRVSGSSTALPIRTAELAAEGSAEFRVELPTEQPGEHQVELNLGGSNAGLIQARLTYTVPDYYRTDYGQLLDDISGNTAVWWCDATHKIAPKRPAPRVSGSEVQLSAAGNDFEAVQIVVRPKETLHGLTATATALSGPLGETIPADNVQILRVGYHFVDQPTDHTGVRDFWPDALPPLDRPIDVEAGSNQPLWVLVHVPRGAKAGYYTGKVLLKAEGFSAEVPLTLHVWDFSLPVRNHIETAFGFTPGEVFRYHGLKTVEQKRQVLEMYWQSFADHRMSPYNPTPLDPIRVNFAADADPPRTEIDFSAFDRAMTRAVEKFHFTNFRLPMQGMGSGSYHSRSNPRIGGFGEQTPEYQAMFASYVKQLEEHLREKGWLEMAYIYWFDEPNPKDYGFVANGMRRLRKYAPGLPRMLTEEPADNELTDVVDIWCPISYNFDHQKAEQRRADGQRFWWYVCTAPKAPYCTLFIDHSATELRTWLWQTWQRDISGVLVWQSNYWTSDTAFPESPQNPYEDPMGYVTGYSTPKGTKLAWGNGDGRFIYPPESAATPASEPVIAPPVSSIRWEMLREGIEDYEMLYLLRQLLSQHRDELTAQQIEQYEALLKVPDEITQDMTTFTTDPRPIYARRAKVAEAIERLAR